MKRKEQNGKRKIKIPLGVSNPIHGTLQRTIAAHCSPFATLTFCCRCLDKAESGWKFGPWKRYCCHASVFLKMLVRSLMDWCDRRDSQISAEFILHIKQIASSQALGDVETPLLILTGYSEGAINWSITVCLNTSYLLWVTPMALLVA